MSLNASMDLRELFRELDALTGAADAAARPAAQAGAQVYYDETRVRVPISAKIHATKSKKIVYQPGNLRSAIYQAFDEKDSGKGRAAYRVSWNKSKAFYGRFLEFGTSRMAAKPFLRPAYEAMRRQAAEKAREVLLQRIKERRK